MKTHADGAQQSLLETDYEGGVNSEYDVAEQFGTADFDDDRPLRPINWNLLTADEALAEWMDLDNWVDWLRKSFGLPSLRCGIATTNWCGSSPPRTRTGSTPMTPKAHRQGRSGGFATSPTPATGFVSGSRPPAAGSTVTDPRGRRRGRANHGASPASRSRSSIGMPTSFSSYSTT